MNDQVILIERYEESHATYQDYQVTNAHGTQGIHERVPCQCSMCVQARTLIALATTGEGA